MAFDSVFQGPPSDVAAPGTAQSPSLGVDVVNKTLYISAGEGWAELSAGSIVPGDLVVDGTLQVEGHSAFGEGSTINGGPTTSPFADGTLLSGRVIVNVQENATTSECGLYAGLTINPAAPIPDVAYGARFDVKSSSTGPEFGSTPLIAGVIGNAIYDGVGTGADAFFEILNELTAVNNNNGEVTQATPLFGGVYQNGAGIIDQADVFKAGFITAGSGSTTNTLNNFHATTPGTNGDVVTVAVGLQIDEQQSGDVGTAYQIKSDGVSPSVFAGPISLPYVQAQTVYSVAGTPLPAAATVGVGARAFVSDSTAAATGGFGAPYVGSGTHKVPVYSDGTSWLIG